jgi:hypothetical protein
MEDAVTLPLIVALALGGAGVYIAYRNPKLGAAILVGLAVIGTLYLVWEKDPSVFQTDMPPVSPTLPVQASPVGENHAPTEGLSSPIPPSGSSPPTS